jgi:hypothetical protein
VRWTIIGLTAADHSNWTATGSGALDLRADGWKITSLWRQAGRIYVGKERAFCVLSPTGITTDAYGYDTLSTNGEGVFSPTSLVQFGEFVAAMSHRTINVFDGRMPRDILGDKNRRSLFTRLNHAALSQVTTIVDALNNRVGWGLPLDGAQYPTEIWWYDISKDAWAMDSFAHTSLSLYTGVDVTTIDELAGTIDAQSGTIDGLSASASPRAIVIAGKSNGSTVQFDGSSHNDSGSGIQADYISPALVVRGAEVTLAGKAHVVREEDYLIADALVLTLLDMGSTYTLTVEVSGDGKTFTPFGTVTMTTNGGSEAAPRTVRKKVDGRKGVENQVQFRVYNTTTGVPWGIVDLTPKVDIVGRIK